MKFSDEELMAYVDGEVDDALRARIDAAMAVDPQVAAAVARQRELSARLRSAYDDVLQEPVPERLLATLRPAPTQPAVDNVIELPRLAETPMAGAYDTKPASSWYALAATFVLGIGLGLLFGLREEPSIALREGNLVAQGALADALGNQLAAAQRGDEAVQIGFSFNAGEGGVCRTFALGADQLAGIACHRDEGWRLHMLVTAPATAAGEYRQASSALPPAVLAEVEKRIVGEPLDATAEQQARQRDWHAAEPATHAP